MNKYESIIIVNPNVDEAEAWGRFAKNAENNIRLA